MEVAFALFLILAVVVAGCAISWYITTDKYIKRKLEHYRARLSRYEDPDNDPIPPDQP